MSWQEIDLYPSGGLSMPNRIRAEVHVESGCDPTEGEYGVTITSFLGGLRISPPSSDAVDDVDMITLCIDEAIAAGSVPLPSEGFTIVELVESGEWQDVFWHGYYIIERHQVIEVSGDNIPWKEVSA